MKTALITGITGQDGSYLAELLLEKGYDVHGIVRRASSFNTQRIDHLLPTGQCSQTAGHLHLHYGDMMDQSSLRRVLTLAQPDEVYNLAAQSHVKVSFDQPVYTSEVVAIGTVNILEAIRDYRDATGKEVRFYQASSSEMFGSSPPPQSETTPFRPVSPYACAKVYAFHMVRTYREAYGLHASNGILFNHESPRRGETFVTRKITRAIGRILAGLQDKLYLGNLEAWRDWGFAGDYVRAMWLMLQHYQPDDYVVATGYACSVGQFARAAFETARLQDWEDYVQIDDRYRRPNEIDELRGNSAKAQAVLNWRPKVSINKLIPMMVDHDRILAKQEAAAARVVS